MERLLVVSDTHGNHAVIEEIKEKYAGAISAVIHCGDSELPADHPALDGVKVVRGNCDFDDRLANELSFVFGDESIFVTHGHLFRIYSSLITLSYRAKELEATMVFFGHTHIPGAERNEGIVYINPGSLLLPRGKYEGTYALVTIEDSSYTIQFFTINHEEIESLKSIFKKN